MSLLKNNFILIISGSSGISHGVADKALAEGAKVHIASSSKSQIWQSVDTLKKKYPQADISGQACDLEDSQVDKNLENLLESTKPLDHIIYTAGDAFSIGSLDRMKVDAFHKAGYIRFAVPLLLAKYVPRYLNRGYQSSYTLTSGAGGKRPFAGWSLVSSYLTGLQGLVRNLALDLQPTRVNLVSPGVVATPLHGPVGVSEEFNKHTTLDKVGAVEEVAEAYIYFIKDTNATSASISNNAGSLLL